MDPESDAGAEPTPEPSRRPEPPRRKRGSLLRELVIIVVSALLLSWLVKTYLVQPFSIPSSSMEDTLVEGDRVLVSKLVPRFADVRRGDVIVFKDPGGWLGDDGPEDADGLTGFADDALTFVGLRPQDAGEHLIKRVVGVGGDQVACCDDEGRVSVNGVPLDETYLKPGVAPSQTEFDTVVPEDSYWVMGDNRPHSHDSRYTGGLPGGGYVPLDDVVGVAFAKVWPVDRLALMKNPEDVFEPVGEP